ncbi:MAG: large subunit ribosomal protein L31e [Natronomonas sp.]|jgi:large subunit ribosomal protein L31e|uniref:50S ribosomal protein L31e n=1 Tax=Natronomonas TaxID=63743 RepID=UPI0015B77F58|nr:50S ribosomal protein L31e [Natronomonas halophila]QLD86364.1 50S ribosomal protein L31e [Natronomonas halophila]
MSAEFDERVMTVPLRDVLAESKGQRADKAMNLVRSHLAQHFNVDEDAVRLDPSINEEVWSRGRSKPPKKLRVRAARFEEEGEAVVEAETA